MKTQSQKYLCLVSPQVIKQFIKILKRGEYQFETHKHKALFTVEDSVQFRGKIKGSHSKNLFLKNKKNKFFLFSCEENDELNLKKISKSFNLGNISFAKKDDLINLLGVEPGSVSPYALLNDFKNIVSFYLETKLHDSEFISFHPLTNTSTITLKSDDFVKFMIENNKKINIFSSRKGVVIKTYGQQYN